jgi:hypothetical protein
MHVTLLQFYIFKCWNYCLQLHYNPLEVKHNFNIHNTQQAYTTADNPTRFTALTLVRTLPRAPLPPHTGRLIVLVQRSIKVLR